MKGYLLEILIKSRRLRFLWRRDFSLNSYLLLRESILDGMLIFLYSTLSSRDSFYSSPLVLYEQ